MSKTIISGLNPKEYEHPYDRLALNALKQTPGIESFTRKFNEYWSDRVLKIQYTGSNLKVTSSNFPDIYDALLEACSILSVSKIPELYLRWSYDINAFTAGVESPIIVLNSGTLDLLNQDELLFIIGHELGHIKSKHVLYSQIAQIMPVLGNIIGSTTLGIGSLVSTGLQLAILNWSRMSEFSADRAGLLACQNVDAATTAMIKLAGVPEKYFDSIKVDDFIQQAKEFDSYDYESLDKAAKFMSIMGKEHPWTVMRAAEFYKWIESGQYNTIINRTPVNISDSIIERNYCVGCGCKLSIEAVFCPNCGVKS